MDIASLGVGVVGGGTALTMALELWRRISATKSAVARDTLGTTIEQRNYQRSLDLEKEVKELRNTVLDLSVKLAKAEATIATYKGLFEKVSTGYEKIQAENAAMRTKLGLKETGKEGRPYLPGGAP